MNEQQINELAQRVYDQMFDMLDSEPDCDSDSAGYIAWEVEKAFKQAMKNTFGESPEDTRKIEELLSSAYPR